MQVWISACVAKPTSSGCTRTENYSPTRHIGMFYQAPYIKASLATGCSTLMAAGIHEMVQNTVPDHCLFKPGNNPQT